MPTAHDILARKGSQVHTTTPDATVLEAVHEMNHHKIGAMMVMDRGRLVGMFTERDILRKVVEEQRRPSDILVKEVMTHEVICCEPDTDLDEISAIMKQRRVRHLPVCNRDRVMGLISIGDVNAEHSNSQEQHIEFLHGYIYGRA